MWHIYGTLLKKLMTKKVNEFLLKFYFIDMCHINTEPFAYQINDSELNFCFEQFPLGLKQVR